MHINFIAYWLIFSGDLRVRAMGVEKNFLWKRGDEPKNIV